MSKTYKLSLGESAGYAHPHPERTARRTAADGWDIFYQVWSNRKAMARTIRMQEKSAPHWMDWKAVVPLGTTEGY